MTKRNYSDPSDATAARMRFRVQSLVPRGLIIAVSVLGVLLAGCVSFPTGKYEELCSSGEEVLNDAVATFAQIETLQRHYEVVVAPDAMLTTNSFEPPVVAGRPTDIVPELQFRENAIRTVAKYLTVLNAFSAKDYQSAVDAASIELAGSLENLERSAGALRPAESKEASGVFSTVVDVIGREVVREKRIKALRTVMQAAQPDLAVLCDLIAHDNEKIGQDIDLMIGRLIAHANADRPAYGTADRIAFDERIGAELWQAKIMKESLKAMGAAISQIPAAHKEIEDCLEKKSSAIEGLKSLAEEAERANVFYRNLK